MLDQAGPTDDEAASPSNKAQRQWGSAIDSAAMLFDWSDSSCPGPLLEVLGAAATAAPKCDFGQSRHQHQQQQGEEGAAALGGGIVVLAADVLYFKEAVGPLLLAVRTVASSYYQCVSNASVVWKSPVAGVVDGSGCSTQEGAAGGALRRVWWILWFMPRSLRRKDNAATFLLLLQGIALTAQGVRGEIVLCAIRCAPKEDTTASTNAGGDGGIKNYVGKRYAEEQDDMLVTMDDLRAKIAQDPLWFPEWGCRLSSRWHRVQ